MARTRLQRSNVLVAPEADSAKPFLSLNFLKHTVKAFLSGIEFKILNLTSSTLPQDKSVKILISSTKI